MYLVSIQVLEEIKALHGKVGRLVHNSEQEWGRLSIIIQQDRQARVSSLPLNHDHKFHAHHNFANEQTLLCFDFQ